VAHHADNRRIVAEARRDGYLTRLRVRRQAKSERWRARWPLGVEPIDRQLDAMKVGDAGASSSDTDV
jgi:hypothetical protein